MSEWVEKAREWLERCLPEQEMEASLAALLEEVAQQWYEAFHRMMCERDEARAEVERLRKQLASEQRAAKAWEITNEANYEEVERLRGKLQRVRDAIKFAANSDGGLVAEIDNTLRGGEK